MSRQRPRRDEGRAARCRITVAADRRASQRRAAAIGVNDPALLGPLAGEWVQLLCRRGADARRTHRAWREHGSAPTHLANGRARWSGSTEPDQTAYRPGRHRITAPSGLPRPRARPSARSNRMRPLCSPTRRTSLEIVYMLAPGWGHDDGRTADLDPGPAARAISRSDRLRRPLAGGVHALYHDAFHAPEQTVAPAIGLCSATAKCSKRGLRLMRQNAHERDRCRLHYHPVLFPVPQRRDGIPSVSANSC